MKMVMIDLHKTDALIQVAGLQYGHNEAMNLYYAQVLEKHGVTQAQFDSSLVWYTAHPQLFDKIYPKVIAQLEAEKADFLNTYEAELNEEIPQEESIAVAQREPLSEQQLDSILWVVRNGYPSMWHPYHKPLLYLPTKAD